MKSDDERAEIYQKAEGVLDKDSAIVPLYYYVNTVWLNLCRWLFCKDPPDNLHTKDLYYC